MPSANEVWKWVVQLGQERAGFYSNDWLENLVLSNIHNSDAIRPEWQQRQKGDRVFGAGGAIYQQKSSWQIKAYEEGQMLYLWGPIVVLPLDAHNSLLITRTYAQPSSVITQLSYDWMHFVMEKGMLLGIKARAEDNVMAAPILSILSSLGWIIATLGMAAALFFRRRGWGWGLMPLAYAAAILIFTFDIWSAMAGFMWWGVIAAGFLVFGRGWWKGLALATALVVLIFVLAQQPQLTFGILFLVVTLGVGLAKYFPKTQRATVEGFGFIDADSSPTWARLMKTQRYCAQPGKRAVTHSFEAGAVLSGIRSKDRRPGYFLNGGILRRDYRRFVWPDR